MSSPAKLPGAATRNELNRLRELMDEVRDGLYALCDDERWKIWNDGGAPFGKPQFPGPGGVSAEKLFNEAERLATRLENIEESFDHRIRKEAERAETLRRRRAERA